MMAIRWPDGTVRCPKCQSEKLTYLQNARVYKCYRDHPKTKFSLKVGTVFGGFSDPARQMAACCVDAGKR